MDCNGNMHIAFKWCLVHEFSIFFRYYHALLFPGLVYAIISTLRFLLVSSILILIRCLSETPLIAFLAFWSLLFQANSPPPPPLSYGPQSTPPHVSTLVVSQPDTSSFSFRISRLSPITSLHLFMAAVMLLPSSFTQPQGSGSMTTMVLPEVASVLITPPLDSIYHIDTFLFYCSPSALSY